MLFLQFCWIQNLHQLLYMILSVLRTDHIEEETFVCFCFRNVHLAVSARWGHAPCSWLEALHCWVGRQMYWKSPAFQESTSKKVPLLWSNLNFHLSSEAGNLGNNLVSRSHTPELEYTQRMLKSMGLKVSLPQPPLPLLKISYFSGSLAEERGMAVWPQEPQRGRCFWIHHTWRFPQERLPQRNRHRPCLGLHQCRLVACRFAWSFNCILLWWIQHQFWGQVIILTSQASTTTLHPKRTMATTRRSHTVNL